MGTLDAVRIALATHILAQLNTSARRELYHFQLDSYTQVVRDDAPGLEVRFDFRNMRIELRWGRWGDNYQSYPIVAGQFGEFRVDALKITGLIAETILGIEG